MIENVDLDSNTLKIKGRCRVELRDAETGELTDVQEGSNFITSYVMTTFLRQLQKTVMCGCYNGGIAVGPYSSAYGADGFFKNIVLTDSTLAESPTTEYSIPGNMIGWANRSPYVGSSTVEGSINQSESFADENRVHWVFDFPTNAANGTINSVCWAYAYPETPGLQMITSKLVGTNATFIGKGVRAYNRVCAGDGYIWGYVGSPNMLYKIDPATFQEIASFNLSSISPIIPSWGNSCFFVLNGYFYYASSSNSHMCKINLSTLVVTDGGYVCPNSLCFATDGTSYIYVGGYNQAQVFRLNLATLGLVDQKVIPYLGGYSMMPESMVYIGGVLYLIPYSGGTINRIAAYNYVANTIAGVTGNCGDLQLFSDGTTLYTSYTEQYTIAGGSGGYVSNTQVASYPSMTGFQANNLLARKLLGSPVVKTSSKTMKIIYEFTFS
jgi:hypothetical protein